MQFTALQDYEVQDMIARTRSKAVVKYTILAALTLTGAMLKSPKTTLLLL